MPGSARQSCGLTSANPPIRLALIPAGHEHILEQKDGKKHWAQLVTELSCVFAHCVGSDYATAIRDVVRLLTHPPPLGGFALRESVPPPAKSARIQALQAALNKQSGTNRLTPELIDATIRQLASKVITTEGQVIDVFTAASLPKPDV